MDSRQEVDSPEPILRESALSAGTARKRSLSITAQASSTQPRQLRVKSRNDQNKSRQLHTVGSSPPTRTKPAGVGSEGGRVVGTRGELNVQTTCFTSSGDHLFEYGPPLSVSTPEALCFRVGDVPLDWNGTKLLDTIYQVDPLLRNHKHFRLSLSQSGSTQTALLIFEGACTEYFGSIGCNESRHTPTDLMIDRHFHGMTVLYTPPGKIAVDVIAVTGLAGHAVGSWRHRGTHRMWLKDFLPNHLKDARIITYGYDCRLNRPYSPHYRLVDLRRAFLEEMENFRVLAEERPIIFIGHSLGGLLILEVLIESNKNKRYKHILQSTRGLVFFGIPLDGLRTEELEKTAIDINTKSTNNQEEQRRRGELLDLIRKLNPGSDYLEGLRDDARILNGFPDGSIISFYETVTANTIRLGNDGQIERGDHRALMVERFSALLRIPPEHIFPIDEDHSNMVKFSSPIVRSYKTVVRCMLKCISTTSLDDILNQVKDGRISSSRILDLLSSVVRPATGVGFNPDNPHHFWILKNSVFQDWVSSPSSQLLCVSRKDKLHLDEIALLAADRLEKSGNFVFYYSCVSARAQRSEFVSFAHSLLHEIIKVSEGNLKSTLLHTFLQTLREEHKLTEGVRIKLHEDAEGILKELLNAPRHLLMKAVRLTLVEWMNGNHSMVIVIDGLDDVGQENSDFHEEVLEIVGVRGMGTATVGALFTGRSNVLFRDTEGFKFVDYSTTLMDCLSSLNTKASRYHNILPEHEGSFEWLWSHPEYLAWLESPNSSLLFVKGKPGSGKSTLCKYFLCRATGLVGGGLKPIVDQRLSLPKPSCTLCHRSTATFVASFFYSDRDYETSHIMMLKMLLYQILEQNADFLYHYNSEFADNKGNWTYDSLVNVLISLGDHPVNECIYLLIDALDESDMGNGERKKLVESLGNLCKKSGNCVVKVFLASRPVNEVPDTMLAHTIYLHEHTRSDIARYTSSLLQDLSVSAEIPDDIAGKIVDRAEGVFIWVHYVGKILTQLAQNGCSGEDILQALEKLPSDLEKIYQRILDKICGGTPQGRDERDIQHSKTIFSYTLFAMRPLTINELRHVLAVYDYYRQETPTGSNFKHCIISISGMERRVVHCGQNLIGIGGSNRFYQLNDLSDEPNNIASFVETENENEIPGVQPVQPMHQTVRNFLLLSSSLAQLRIDKSIIHCEITIASYRYLDLFCQGPRNIQLTKDLELWTTDNFEHFVRYIGQWEWINYIVSYLPAHLRKCRPNEQVDRLKLQVHNKLVACNSMRSLLAYWVNTNALLLQDQIYQSQGAGKDSTDLTCPKEPCTPRSFVNRILPTAAKLREFQVVDIAIKCGAHVESLDGIGQTMFHWIAEEGHEATARLLLDRGADIKARTGDGETPLHCATKRVRMVLLLLDYGADIEAKNRYGRTPLHCAAQNGHESTVRLLLDRGAKIEAKDGNGNGWTSLHWAAQGGHEAIVRLLLDRGAKIKSRTGDGKTPLHCATKQADMVLLLLNHGADIEAKDDSGQTPLYNAVMLNMQVTVRLLLDRGADVEARFKGRTVLHQAAMEKGHEAIVRLLLDRGADIEAKDSGGYTPLRRAAQFDRKATVQLLRDHGATDFKATTSTP